MDSIQQITQFQQMTCTSQTGLTQFIRPIKHILKRYSLQKADDESTLHQELSILIEKLQSSNLCSQKIVSLMIGSKEAQQQIKAILWRHLRESKQSAQLLKQYEDLRKQMKQNYSIANTGLNILVKDILDNVKLIEQELINLANNVRDIRRTEDLREGEEVGELSLYVLLRIVMEDSSIQFSERMNELVFRMYILEESLTLIFLKTQKALEEIADRLNDAAASRRESMNSERTGKKSALSESIEIFKKKQLREQAERNQLLYGQRQGSQIQSDYKMTRKAEKGAVRFDSRPACCFRF